MTKTFHQIRIGDTEVIALQDSWLKRPPDEFFVDVGAEDWAPYPEWLDENGLIDHNFGCFAIRSLGKTILVDTGLGQWPNEMPLQEESSLLETMEQAGISPAEVDLVLFTHLHFDHVGWNTRGEEGALEPTFPNARYVAQKKEFDFWMSPGEKPSNRPDYDKVLAPIIAAGLLDLVDSDYTATSEIATVPTPGHTPGHVSYAIVSGGDFAYVLGDAIHKPVQATEPDWYPGFDMDPILSTKSRHMILDRAESEEALLAAGHFAFPSMGRMQRIDGRRTFVYVS